MTLSGSYEPSKMGRSQTLGASGGGSYIIRVGTYTLARSASTSACKARQACSIWKFLLISSPHLYEIQSIERGNAENNNENIAR